MDTQKVNCDRAVVDEASRWFALLRAGGASQEDRNAFEIWRESDPRHAAAYEHALSTWTAVGELHDLRELLADDGFSRMDPSPFGVLTFLRRLIIRQPVSVGVFASALAAVAFALIIQPAWLLPNVYATKTAETELVALPDGSMVDLAPESRIKIAFSKDERRVDLAYGEAFFEVRKGDDRVFIVASGDAEVRVTGTKFNVHQGPAGVTVSVAEGKVEVRNRSSSEQADPAAAIIEITAGEQVVATHDDTPLTPRTPTPASKIGAWRAGHLHYDDSTLREVIADANRYSRIPIVVADGELNELRLVAAFRTTQIDSMIDGLADILPVTIDRNRNDRIVVRASGDPSG